MRVVDKLDNIWGCWAPTVGAGRGFDEFFWSSFSGLRGSWWVLEIGCGSSGRLGAGSGVQSGKLLFFVGVNFAKWFEM
jgi:hypothetical protein